MRRGADTRETAHIPIVALTARAIEGPEECLAAGMDDYLTKPLRREELVTALARAGRPLPVERSGS